ncbi:MAG TPA: ABC transporter ATP-binding protein [Gemmatimonadaceae bacterium]|nr:ABC transporter ATP-binding protein [Gemmatimonadaceae bacterium]
MERLTVPLLDVRNLTLRFGGVCALDDVSFDVRQGELFAIIGPNGAGKTSIFNCLNGVYKPERGSISLDGTELVGRRPASIATLGIARTFQNLGLFHHLTVLENLLLGRHCAMRTGFLSGAIFWGPAKREEIAHRQACEDIIELLELEPYRFMTTGRLPYGVLKRVELGRALAMQPKILLLDEPVAGMNLEETEDMARFILEINEELRTTTILVEHDMRMVMDIAHRVLALDFGKVLAVGAAADVQGHERVVQAYLGSLGERVEV